jgi:virginiamycin B lyase
MIRRLLGLSIGLIVSLLAPAAASAIDEFPLPAGTKPGGITTGPDGALWFTEEGTYGIGRITTSGAYTHYGGLALGAIPDQIAVGPDGALWVTIGNANAIGRLDPAAPPGSAIQQFTSGVGGGPAGITAAGGALWYTTTTTSPNSIRRIDTNGNVDPAYTIPLSSSTADPSDITPGPDGRLWFTEQLGDAIGAVTPAAGATPQRFPLAAGSQPSGIISTGGALWFTESGAGAIGQISTAGTITEFPGAGTDPSAIEAGRDGALWYTLGIGEVVVGSCQGAGENSIGRLTTGGTFTNKFATPTPASDPADITEGPDGQLWFSEHCASKIGRVLVTPPAPPPPPPVATLSVSSLRVSPTSFRAASAGASVAAKKKKKRKTGATVRYTLSRAAKVKFTVERVEKGRKRGKKCVKAKGRKKGRKCNRYVRLKGSFTHAGKAGGNKFRFSGRVSRKKLKPAKYRLNAVATAGPSKSKVKRASFKIIR